MRVLFSFIYFSDEGKGTRRSKKRGIHSLKTVIYIFISVGMVDNGKN
jgi:hypothetical protein